MGFEVAFAGPQARVRHLGGERGWDQLDPAHSAWRLRQERGEVAREARRLEGVAGGMADPLIPLANTTGVDLERSLREKMGADRARLPLERYHKRQAGRCRIHARL